MTIPRDAALTVAQSRARARYDHAPKVVAGATRVGHIVRIDRARCVGVLDTGDEIALSADTAARLIGKGVAT